MAFRCAGARFWGADPLSAFERGLEHFRAGRYEQAKAELSAAVRGEPANPQAWRYLAATHFSLGDYLGAREPAEQCVSLTPGDPSCHLNLAIVLRKLGDWEEARAVLDECLRQRPDYEAARTELGKHNAQAPLAPSWAPAASEGPEFDPL